MPAGLRTRLQPLFWLIAAVSVGIGSLGLMDARNIPYSGFFANRNATVVRVFEGGPADDAGLREGDVIRTTGGIPVEAAKQLARRPRAKIGETRVFDIERAGEPMTVELVFERQPARNRLTFALAYVVGLCFVLFTLIAYQKAPRSSTLLLALFGLCFGIAFLPGPYSPSFALRTLGNALATTAVILGFAFLVHFLLTFPRRLAPIDRPWAQRLIYGPAAAVALFFLFQILFQPDATSTLRQVSGVIVGLFIAGYFGWALVNMLRSFRAASAGERSRDGLTLMLCGTLAGLLPITISSLVTLVAPDFLLPGAQYYSLTLGLIPIAFALATLRRPEPVAA